MKTFRLLAAALFLSAFGTIAPAQESNELSSLRAKAERGNGVAQYNLGLAYAEGRGVPTDRIEAYVWLSLAWENGARGRALDNLVTSLDKATFAAAQQRLTERKGTAVAKGPPTPGTPTGPASQQPLVEAPAAATPATPAVEPAALVQQVTALAAEKKQLSDEVAQTRKEIEGLKAELARTKQSPATLEQAPRPAADPAALEQKTRELQAVTADLENARNFSHQVEDSLNKVNNQKAGLEAALAEARKPAAPAYPDLSGRVRELEAQVAATNQQIEVGAQTVAATRKQSAADLQTASEQISQLKTALAVKPAAPAYPDLSGRVRELEAALAAKPAAPAYPDLSGRVTELEAQVASGLSAVAATKAEAGRAQQEAAALTQAKAGAEQRATALESELAAAQTSAHNLARLEQEKAQLTAALESARKPDGRIEQAVSRGDTLERELRAETTRRAAAEASLAQATEQLTALSAEAGKARQEVAALTKAKTDAEHDTATTNEAQAGLRATIARLEQEKTQLVAAQNASGEAAHQIAGLNEKAAAAEKQTTSLRQERDALSTKLTDLAGEIAQLRDDRERMQKLLADAGKKLRDSTTSVSRIKELETQTAGLQSSLAAAEAQATGLTSERDTARVAQNESRDTIAKLEQEKKQLAAAQNAAPTYPDLSGKVRELEAQVVAAKQQADTTAQTAAATGKQSAADLNAATEQIAGLRTALAAKPAAPAYPDLSGKVRELESAAADSARQLAASGTAQSELQRQLAAATTALQNAAKTKGGSDDPKLRRERDELSGRVTTLASEIAQLRTDRERMQKLLADSGKQLRDSMADASRIKELETQVSSDLSAVASAKAEASQAREQITALTKAKEEVQAQISSLQNSLTAKSAPPTYPDLSGKVSELETQLNNLQTAQAAKSAAPAYPNLSGRVAELETALADSKRQLTDTQTALRAAGQANPAPAAPEANPTDLQKQLAETEDKLATALRGYALLERERDEQVAKLTTEVEQLKAGAQSSSAAQAEVSRLNESLTALQRSTAQNSSDLAATHALLQQVQGANAVLAGENYQLKTTLSRSAGTSGPVNVVPVSAPPAVPAARTHVVVSGDSLSRISQSYYGTANRWQEIYNANRDKISSEGVLRVGTELRIP